MAGTEYPVPNRRRIGEIETTPQRACPLVDSFRQRNLTGRFHHLNRSSFYAARDTPKLALAPESAAALPPSGRSVSVNRAPLPTSNASSTDSMFESSVNATSAAATANETAFRGDSHGKGRAATDCLPRQQESDKNAGMRDTNELDEEQQRPVANAPASNRTTSSVTPQVKSSCGAPFTIQSHSQGSILQHGCVQ
jgi:hypothetical protein